MSNHLERFNKVYEEVSSFPRPVRVGDTIYDGKIECDSSLIAKEEELGKVVGRFVRMRILDGTVGFRAALYGILLNGNGQLVPIKRTDNYLKNSRKAVAESTEASVPQGAETLVIETGLADIEQALESLEPAATEEELAA